MMVDGGRGTIYAALKNIQAKWDVVEPHWNDVMRLKFVEEVWTPLQQQTRDALEAIDQLQVFLHQMRRDCEGVSYDIHASQ